MERVTLGKTGYQISPIFYGGIVSMEEGQTTSDSHVAYAIEHGINYFDVAPTYGDAEVKLGNSIKPYRKDIYLACKTEQRHKKGAQETLETSFRLLHTDYFDVFQLHALGSIEEVDTAFGPGGAMEVLEWAKKEGYVRKLGITCHSEEAALKALSLYDFDTVLFPMNWGMHLAKNFGDQLFTYVKDKNIGLLGMKSMIHRAWKNDAEKIASTFTKSWCKPIIEDKDFTIAAMKYALSLGADALVPPGNFTHFSFAVEHIDECLKHPLTAEDTAYLKERLAEIEGLYFF